MTIFDSVWAFLKKYWLQVLAFIGVIVIVKDVDDALRKKPSESDQVKVDDEQAKQTIDNAKKEEIVSVNAATAVAEAQKEVRDTKIQQARAEEDKHTDQQVQKKVDEELKEPLSETAKDFASLGGGTYVKSEE